MALCLLVLATFLIPLVCGAENESASDTALKKLPVKYGGPIVFSKAPPPVIYFPDPPKVSQQDVLEASPTSVPKQVEYVPLPFEDLPILIYKSTDTPPIHVVSPSDSSSSEKDQSQSQIQQDSPGDLRSEASETSASSSRYEARRLTPSYPRSYQDTSANDAYRDLAADLFAAFTRQIGYKSNPIYVEAPDPPKPVFVSSSSRPSAYQARGTYSQLGGSAANSADYGGSYQGGGRSSSSYQGSASAPHIVYTGHPPIHLYTSPIIIKGSSENRQQQQEFGEYVDASEQKPVAVAIASQIAKPPAPQRVSNRGRSKVGESILTALSTLGMAANPFSGPSSTGIGRTITGLRRPGLFGAPSWASALGLAGSAGGSKSPFRFSASEPATSSSNMNYAFAAMNPQLSSYFGNLPSSSSNSYQSRPLSNPLAALFGGSSGSSSGSRFKLSNLLKPSSSNNNPFSSLLSAYGFGPSAENLSPFETGYALGTLSSYGIPFTPQSSSSMGAGFRPAGFNFNPSNDLSFSGSTKHAAYVKPPRGIGHSFYTQKSTVSAGDDLHGAASYSRARYRVPPTAATAAPRHHKPPIIIYQGVRPPVHIYKKQDLHKAMADYGYHGKASQSTYHPPHMIQEKPSSSHYIDHSSSSYSDPDPNAYGSPSNINDHEKHGSMYSEKPIYDSPGYGDKSIYPEKGSSYSDKLLYQDKYSDSTVNIEDQQQYTTHYQPTNYETYNPGNEFNSDSDIGEYVDSHSNAHYQGDQPQNYQQSSINGFSQSSNSPGDKSWIPLQSATNSNYAEAHALSGAQTNTSIQNHSGNTYQNGGQDSNQDSQPADEYKNGYITEQSSFSARSDDKKETANATESQPKEAT